MNFLRLPSGLSVIRARLRSCHRISRAGIAILTVIGCMALTAPPASAVTDTTAPVLVSFSLTPSSVDTSAAAATITVTARITDDVSGLANSGNYVLFYSPTGNRNVQVTFDGTKRISGTALDGVYRTTMTVPRYSEQGTWHMSYGYLTDAVGHQKYLATSDFTLAGFPTTFSQTGIGDTTPPVLAGFSISPASVDSSAAAATITLTAHITDDVSGFPGTGCCGTSFSFTSPSGSRSVAAYVDASKRISGTPQDGTYRTTLVLPRYSEQGTWLLSSAVSLTDVAGNPRYLYAGDFVDAGFPTSFQQTGVGDITAPVLAGFSISPATVDTSAAPATITVTARITDDVSGFTNPSGCCYSYSFYFTSASGRSSQSFSFDASKRISGTAQDGTYRTTITLPRYAEQGTWQLVLQYVYLYDLAGNSRQLSLSDFTTAGFPTTFQQTGVGDITPPVLAGFSISPATVDTSAASATITVTARITDDVSGFTGVNGGCCNSFYLSFTSPSGRSSPYVSFDSSKRISGTAQDGTYRTTFILPRYSEQGTWQLSSQSMYLSDVAGNSRSLTSADFATAGFPITFQQTGVGDITPPVLAGFSISPATVDTSAASATITVTARITDDLSGFTGVSGGCCGYSLYFASPSGRSSQSFSFDASKRISGTAQDGTYRTTITLPRYAEQGTWQLGLLPYVYLYDAAGNSRPLSLSDFTTPGFPTTFQQTGVGDIIAPALTAFSFTPASIDTSGAARTIMVTAHLTDNVSGVANSSPCCYYLANTVTFKSPSGARSVSATFDSSNRISGTALDGIYQAPMTVPRYAETGTWQLTGATLVDAAGNNVYLAPADFTNAGYPTSFVQTGIADTTAPTIASLSFSPGVVDVSTAPQTVTIRARIVDDLVGLGPSLPTFSFVSPSLGQYTSAPADGVRFVAGTAQDATFDFDVVVPRFSEAGTWHLGTVYLSDALGNTRTLSAADFSAAGFPTTLVVSDPPGTAPTITSPTSTAFTVGTAGTFTVTATGNPVPGLSVTGALPAGVTFNTTTSVLSGTPAAGTAGTWPLRFTATNGTAPNATQDFTLTVNDPTLTNHLTNPGFELASGGWSTNASFTRSTAVAPHEGTFEGRFSGTANTNVTITQTVTGLSAGATYLFSGWANIPVQNDATFSLKFQVRWLDASNTTINTTLIKNYTATTTGWNQATKNLVAPAGTTHAQIRMVMTSLNGAVYVDDMLFR